MNAVTQLQPSGPSSPVPVPQSETAAIVSMIERAARDPAVDIDKMERLLQMQERILAREAKAAYDAALAEMQPKLPVIGRRGKIEIREKDKTGERNGKVQQSTPYALWEDINEGIRPVLAEHGFALSFRVGQAADGKITITGILSHRAGHREETTITLMHDSSGSKNSVQAVGSSVSYGKRYTAAALLNITSRGEDDDGKAAGAAETISPEQAKALRDTIDKIDVVGTEARLLRWARVDAIEDIPAARYEAAVANLNTVKQS